LRFGWIALIFSLNLSIIKKERYMMSNVFEPVRIKGKLFAKNTTTGSIAPKDTIRHIQLLNAEKNREVLVVSATGRVTRVPAADMGVALTPPPVAKLSFMQAKQVQDPEDMFKNIERLTKMVGRGIQPSLVITGGAGTGKTHLVKSTLEQMGLKSLVTLFTSRVVLPLPDCLLRYMRIAIRLLCWMTATPYSKTMMQ
jgi:DNA replication protein DnaC